MTWTLLEEFSSWMLEDYFSLPSEFVLFGNLPVGGWAEESIQQIDKLSI